MNKRKIILLLMATTVIFTSVSVCFAGELDYSNKIVCKNLICVKTERNNEIKEEKDNDIEDEDNVIKEDNNKIITEKEAEEIAEEALKKYFNIDFDKNEDKFSIDINFDNNDMTKIFWNMEWCKKNGQTIYAAVNGKTGEITYMSNYEYTYNIENSKEVISMEEAKKISTEFVKKINPKNLKESNSPISYGEQHGVSRNFMFKYERNVNGIDFKGNYIIVCVNAFNGKVTEYECVWDDKLNFPENKNIIDDKTAEQKFRENLKIELSYIKQFKKENGKLISKVKLVYIPVLAPGDYIEAKNGDMVEFNADLEENIIDINEEEKNMLSAKYKIKKKYGLDKKNEELPFRLTWKEAYYKALDTIAEYYPDKIKNIRTEQYKFENYIAQYATFNFPRMEDGILYFDNGILIDIDMNTGKVYNKKCIWEEDINFPDRENVLSVDDIKDIIFEKYKPRLVYDIVNTPEGINNNMKAHVKLIYEHNVEKNIFIDANTGEFISMK